jgi:ATP-dependent Clp protease ATP-binding subunit ClpB
MQPTNPNQFTEKAWEAIARTPDIAKAAQHQQIESEHLMKSLLEQEGLASSILNKAGANMEKVRSRTDEFIQRQPKVSGAGTSVYLGRSLDTLLDRAEAYRQEFDDDFISIEHLLLAYAKDDRFGKGLFAEFKLNEAQVKEIIKQVRGSQKVTDQNPEGKYESLEKYGRDLTEAAKAGKLDPVIGRDDEIRRTIQILSRRTKNNPVLIGEPGVGKTAIALIPDTDRP